MCVTDEHAVVANKVERYQAEIKADTVVLALGLKPEDSLVRALKRKVPELRVVGDSKQPGIIMNAIWSAFHTMRLI